MRRTRIKKGDEVMVVTGVHKGETGRVLEVKPDTNKVIVESINVRKRAWKRGVNPNYPDGGIHDQAMPIDASNVMILDPESGEPSRIGIRHEVDDNGRKRRIRVARRSGTDLPEQY